MVITTSKSESEDRGGLQAILAKTQECNRSDLVKDPALQPEKNSRDETLRELHKNRKYLEGLLNNSADKISTIFRKHRKLFHTFMSLYNRIINNRVSRRF